MATQKFERAKWRAFLDRVTKILIGKRAEIEVASLALGDQVEAAWLPLLGIAYDPKDDVIEIASDDLDHMIHKPREMYVETGPAGLISIEVVDADNVRQIIKLRDPLMLPPPSAGRQKATAGEHR